MRGIDTIYTGWGNPRMIYRVIGHDILVMVDGDAACTLHGVEAKNCRDEFNALTNHFCGVRKSPQAAELIARVPDHKHDLNAYNDIFNRHFQGENT